LRWYFRGIGLELLALLPHPVELPKYRAHLDEEPYVIVVPHPPPVEGKGATPEGLTDFRVVPSSLRIALMF
jgi:hypothetical protein